MDITQQELMKHPLMAKVTADIAATRQQQETQRMMDHMEAQRIREDQGKYLASQYKAAVDDYERLRGETHAAVGRIWAAVQAYSRVTGVNPGEFQEATFNTINVPTLKVNSSPWALSSSFTTTQAATMGWFASMGKEWVG